MSACNVGDLGSIPGSGRSPGEGNGNPLQYSCLENPMDGGAWWATVYVLQSRTRLSDFTSLSSLTNLEFFFKWVGSVVISFSFCLFKDLPPCPLSCLLTSYFDLLTICPVFNSFSRTYPRTFVENRCILVSTSFSVIVTKSSHKVASFFILHFFG